MDILIDEKSVWYHGSNRKFKVLRKGSTVTQWKQLAEAFSHKPQILEYDENGIITHNGKKKGYLYVIDEPIIIGVDIYQHPNTVMDKNAEFVTARRLKVKMIENCGK